MTFSKCWCEYNETHDNRTNKHNDSMNNVFANRSNEEEIYPLTVKEIAKAQELDRHFKATALKEKYEKTLTENTQVFCKNGKLVIPRSLQHRAISWFYHYLQHPGNTRLKEIKKPLVGTTTIYSTLKTHASKRQLKLQYSGNRCVPLYAHTSKIVDFAR
jgi:hypothetical protein